MNLGFSSKLFFHFTLYLINYLQYYSINNLQINLYQKHPFHLIYVEVFNIHFRYTQPHLFCES